MTVLQPGPQPGDTGSTPVRVTEQHSQVVEPVDTRRSERRARLGVGVRVSPWLLLQAWQAPSWPS